MILIGSRAMAIRGLAHRPPVDFDFVCTQAEFDAWDTSKARPTKVYAEGKKMIVEGATNCEFEIVSEGSSGALLTDIVSADPKTIRTSMGLVPSLDLLFTLKSSHKHLKNSPHFWKTLGDYHRMKMMGAKAHQGLLRMREKETYTYAHPKLNQNKSKFFTDDNITYTYDHDSIHQAVKTLDQPAYKYFSTDGEEVLSSRERFNTCSREIQLLSVVEESSVLACERSLVPFPGVLTVEQAWRMAFSKVCTSIASGWWRAFAYENALEALRMYPKDYWEKFQAGVASGVVVRG
jgi:hypothetical protein